jgi:hypothetical protein
MFIVLAKLKVFLWEIVIRKNTAHEMTQQKCKKAKKLIFSKKI